MHYIKNRTGQGVDVQTTNKMKIRYQNIKWGLRATPVLAGETVLVDFAGDIYLFSYSCSLCHGH